MLQNEKMKGDVRNYIKENFLFGYEEKELKDDTSFFELGVLDSTGIMELVTFLEREFGVLVADEEIIKENLDSIDVIVSFLVTKLS